MAVLVERCPTSMSLAGVARLFTQSRKLRMCRAWLSPRVWACIGTPSSFPSGMIWKPPRSRNIVASVPWKRIP